MKRQSVTLLLFSCLSLTGPLSPGVAQQSADPNFHPAIAKPAYPQGKGPTVFIDEAHVNFHTSRGRYQPFAELLGRDGYVVLPFKRLFTAETLREADILVIANALNFIIYVNSSLPNPSAFADTEVAAVRSWVEQGGSLFLVADHMPFPGTVEKLTKALGIVYKNGYGFNDRNAKGPVVCKRSLGTVLPHPITNGRMPEERISQIATFTGSAIQPQDNLEPLLVYEKDAVCLMTRKWGQLDKDTPVEPIGGWLLGAVMRLGQGRVAVFSEAAMFSAQVSGRTKKPMGMNAPIAKDNVQFLLNVMHWLSASDSDIIEQ